MRLALLCVPVLVAAGFTRSAPPACSAAALAAAADPWDTATAVTGDLTRDGAEDVVFWKRDGSAVLLYIAACDGDRAVETWRFRVPLDESCPPAEAAVEVTSLLMDAALVDRVCASGETEECQHMRMENRRRQVLTDAGGRDLRVGGKTCPGTRFRWSAEKRGFMRIGG